MGNRILYNTAGSIALAIDHEKIGTSRILEATGQTTIKIAAEQYIRVSDAILIVDTDVTIDWNDLDTGSPQAGKDYYVYACLPASGSVPVFKISLNSTYPSGYDASNSRKIGGFHTLCADVGTISGHPLSGYVATDILPDSVWDLDHRPVSNPEGMVYSEKAGIWVDIYLASGTGSNTASAYGATISDTRNWMDFVDDFASVNKQLLDDAEFQVIAAGSNEETNISGSADPVTTGGHSDTAGRRMISSIGCEDCCGAMWQWLRDQSWRADGLPDTGDPTWAWEDLTGSKGSLYKQGTYGDVKLLAGGPWSSGPACGSRSRSADNDRWGTSTSLGGRGRSEPRRA